MNAIPLIVEKINNLNSLEAIKNVWNSLLEENDTKTTELTYEWQISFWNQFNRDAELFVLIIREAGSIIAISPLKLVIKSVIGFKIRSLEIIAGRTSNYQDLIIGRNNKFVLACILDYLMTDRGSWDQLSLWHIPETSTTAHFFSENLGNYPLLKIAETGKCMYLALDKSWEEHKKSLGKNRERQMNKRMRRIERDLGKIQLRKSTSGNQLISDLQIFSDLHRKRWNQTNTPSEFLDSRYCTFYSEVGLQLLPKGQLGLTVLEAGGTTLALLLFFSFKQSILLQLSAYDPDYSYYSPMVVLTEQFVEETLANGFNEIDFGAYYPYKEAWANHLKNRVSLIIFPKNLKPFILYYLTKFYLALRLSVRQYPKILNFYNTMLRRIRIQE